MQKKKQNKTKYNGVHVFIWLKGQCYAHARASSVFSSKDNRTVMLTWQDFVPNHTATEVWSLLKKSFILFKNFACGTKTSCDFFSSSATLRPKKLVPLKLLVFGCKNWVRGQFVASPSPAIFACVLASKVWKI